MDEPSRLFDAAIRLHQQNRLSEAEAQYRAVVAAAPSHAPALHRLGLLCIQTGRMAEAEDLLRRAAAAAPAEAAIRNHFGLLLLRLGRPAEAAVECEAAVKLAPGFPDALGNLGQALSALGEHDKAIQFLGQALDLTPEDAEILRSLGEAHMRRGAVETGLGFFNRSLAARPRSVATLLGRAEALEILGRQNEALADIDTALAIDPRYAVAHAARGNLLKQLGRRDEAEAAYSTAVALAPDAVSYRRVLGELRPYMPGDSRIAALEALRERDLSDIQNVELQFALFKAHDDLKEHAAAFAALKKGNNLYRCMLPYDEGAMLDSFAALERTFSKELFVARAGQGDMSEQPLFIVGMPRSGTSLIEQMLASHPGVFGAGERTWVQEMALEAMPDYPLDVAAASASLFAELGRRYAARATALRPEALRITDKLPTNFRQIGLIHLMLPKARIIHVRRDPRDTCFSCYSKLFQQGLDFSYDLGELGRYYKAYERLMAHWRAILPDGVMLDVDYEALVGDFETEARRIVEFGGLAWDERCLRFHENKRAVRTLSELQVRQPLFRHGIGRFKPYEAFLAPLFAALVR